MTAAAAGPPRWLDKERAWHIARYGDVALVLKSEAVGLVEIARDLEKLSARMDGAFANLVLLLGSSHPFQNSPAHDAARAALKAMMAETARRWTPQAIAALVQDMLAPLADGPPFDAVRTIAAPLPASVVAQALGLGVEQVQACGALVREVSAVWHRDVTPLRELRAMEEAATGIVELLRAAGKRHDELARLAFLTMAGVDTTAGLIASALEILASVPALQARLRAEPARIAGFVNETLRTRPPLKRLVGRRTADTLRLADREIPPGVNLVVDLERAHRDPGAYPDPDRFDIDRAGPPTLAFGFGAHTCIGAPLARMEARILIERLATDMVIHAAGDAVRGDSPDWNDFASLPLRLERRI
ncbi:MAG: cytochrome P450 [Alphaproteobacteria bacterium]|nr:cytochrome P450 [Alphaproteobacteria bacterium]